MLLIEAIGNTYMLSFGDGVGTKIATIFDPNAKTCTENGFCDVQTARDGGGLQGSDPLRYQDIVTVKGSANSICSRWEMLMRCVGRIEGVAGVFRRWVSDSSSLVLAIANTV